MQPTPYPDINTLLANLLTGMQAALWAEKHFPDWATLIQKTVLWRKSQWHEEGVDHAAMLDETPRFVHFVVDQVAGK